jgi:hypothetical protein
MEFKEIFIITILAGLFIFCIIAGAIQFGNDNGAPINLNQNPLVNRMFGNVNVELNQSSSKANTANQALTQEESNSIITTLGFVFSSVLATGNTFMTMTINVFGFGLAFIGGAFSINPIITGSIMAIIIGTLVLAIWSVIRAGR